MKQPKHADPTEPKKIAITPEQCQEIIDLLSAISELEMLSEHTDDQPSSILKILGEKATPLAEDLFQLKRQAEE